MKLVGVVRSQKDHLVHLVPGFRVGPAQSHTNKLHVRAL